MKNNKVFIIAEIGVNHNGSIKNAIKIVNRIVKSGADAVKFQLANPELVYSNDAFKADYQKKNDNSKSVLQMSKKLQIKKEDHIKLQQHCKRKGILYLCSAFDLESLIFLDKNLKIPIFKIPSGEINSIDMINYISKRNKKIILSTGMASLKEIKNAINRLTKHGNKKISILHCVSSYPVAHKDINLNVIDLLKNNFGFEVGYSDHSIGEDACLAAVAKGAKIIEKHVTSSTKQIGPDHRSSMNINDFEKMVKKIRKLELILGCKIKKFSRDELNVKKMARKSIVLNKSLKKGQKIKRKDLTFKRPGTGLSPLEINYAVGRKIKINLNINRVLKKSYLK